MSKYLGLYIHIPFCRSKCPYCDFFSFRGTRENYKEYVEILKKKIVMWSQKTTKTIDTIYFGGGTPSVIGSQFLCDILCTIKNNFKVAKNSEITFEVNPSSGRFFDFEIARKAGFNRVSVGLQSSDAYELKALGRIHNKEDVANTVKLIKKSGINNISLDLMMGIPNQTIESLKKSIDFCLNLDISHISSYMLKIEENTVFYKNRNSFNFPGDDLTSDMYLFTIDYLKNNNFNQYEISNFCKEGFESKHNLKYWTLNDYLGIGPGAHSLMDNRRFYYDRSIEKFANDIIIDDGSSSINEEYIMLRMRLNKGISLKEYAKVFGSGAVKDFKRKIEKYIKYGYIEIADDNIAFTPEGMLVSNTILSDLM